MSISSLLVPAILFFALGMFACIIKSDLKFPFDMHKMIVIYLLMGIGLHGGKALASSDLTSAIPAVWAAFGFGIGLPIIAYIILRGLGKIDPLNAAAISAHYGSVSAGTYMTAVAFLAGINVSHEPYPIIMLAIMESPAIMIGLVLAGYSRRIIGGESKDQKGMMKHLVIDAFTNGSILLLFGSMGIGYVISETSYQKIEPFFELIFMGALCVFLCDMGMEAGKNIGIQTSRCIFSELWNRDATHWRSMRFVCRTLYSGLLYWWCDARSSSRSKLLIYCSSTCYASCNPGGQSVFLLNFIAWRHFSI